MMPAQTSTPTAPIGRRWFAVLGIVAVMLLLPSSCAVNPVLYTGKNASATGFHQDLAVTGDLTRADADLILQEWGTSLNLTGSIVHKIKFGNSESAESDLQQLLSSGKNLRDLVLRLGMTDTDVATFQTDNRLNILSLRNLLNKTEEFDELKAAEATFRDQKNIAGLKSIELQGEDIRSKVRKNYLGYLDRSRRMVNISQRFGLDTSAFEESITEFAAILAEIDAVQGARSSSISEMMQTNNASSDISMEIHPDRGVYGDTLSMSGTVQGPAGREVTIFVDGRQSGSTVTDQNGHYSVPYRVEQIGAQAHTAYASVNSTISNSSSFIVEGRNTTISLAAHVVEENGTVKGIGSGRLVTEDGVPVRLARVYFDVDGGSSGEYGLTGDDGAFTAVTEQLSPRSHTLRARFDPEEFPLNGSVSAPVTVEVPSGPNWVATIVYFFGVGGARRRRGSPPTDSSDERHSAAGSHCGGVSPSPDPTHADTDDRGGAVDRGPGHGHD